MNRYIGKMVLMMLLAIGANVFFSRPTLSGEIVAQERPAYYELNRVRSKSRLDAGYNEYKSAVISARVYVGLLRDSYATASLLRQVMGYYEQALSVWSLRAESELPVDSLNADEPNGIAIINQCPDIRHNNILERDQIYVLDAVKCYWDQAAKLMDSAPVELR
jgi:hypothetical protein